MLQAAGDGPYPAYRIWAGEPGRLRDFEAAGRENGEIELRLGATEQAWTVAIDATIAASPEDGHRLRPDGSFVAYRAGNWLLSAGWREHFWGPGHEGSLILSNNARPMPGLALERAVSRPFGTPLLRWLGPWRLVALLEQMDAGRADVDRPLFFGARVTAQPLPWLEIGVSRTAQLCGSGRHCGPRVFFDMLTGKDNVGGPGVGNVSSADQPGNQMAGYDLRISSPWKAFPVELYGQDIGEDQISYRPTDRLHLYGAELRLAAPGGGILGAYFEYSDTICAAGSGRPVFDCAYTNNVYFAEGYRFQGRSVGHTTDADSLMRAVGLRWIEPSGAEWRLRARRGVINREGGLDPYHGLSPRPLRLETLEAGWRGEILGADLRLELGVERLRQPSAPVATDWFGGLSWVHRLE